MFQAHERVPPPSSRSVPSGRMEHVEREMTDQKEFHECTGEVSVVGTLEPGTGGAEFTQTGGQ